MWYIPVVVVFLCIPVLELLYHDCGFCETDVLSSLFQTRPIESFRMVLLVTEPSALLSLFATNLATLRCTITIILMSVTTWGSHTAQAYYKWGRTRAMYMLCLMVVEQRLRFLRMNHTTLLALATMSLLLICMCGISTPKYSVNILQICVSHTRTFGLRFVVFWIR